MRQRSVRAVTCVLAVVALRGVVACVDGVTPDCSNPAVCAPIEGDAGPLPLGTDSGSDAGSEASAEAGSDAASDAPADAAIDG